ncbi:MAG: cysteine--tRNA ligase [Dehalococcoidia bacterium]|nr:cysteine--tRNA ligase [Dehalococcoidia bacterium]
MRIFNTLTGEKEEFYPQGDEIKLYVCGVTPYDNSHVGHAMSYIVFDVIKRYLEFKGHKVRHVQNFTDVDDKIIGRSQRLGKSALELADEYIQQYLSDMDALNIKPADVYPRVTEEIDEIILLIQTILDKGCAYNSGEDVYFRSSRFDGYGKLSRRTMEGMMAGARVDVSEAKQHPMDFVLWKGAKPGEPAWASPWGLGRPGWHIECSAMALKYLGSSLDIHGGGQDLIFPHHENEIAQSEAATGIVPFAKLWIHNGLLQMGEEKMSKSLGNLVTIEEALGRYSADAIRIFVLGTHYHSPLTYSEEALAGREIGVERLRRALQILEVDEQPSPAADVLNAEASEKSFLDAMEDDFNTARAIGYLFQLATEANACHAKSQSARIFQEKIRKLSEILGLTLERSTGGGVDDVDLFLELISNINADLDHAKGNDLGIGFRERLEALKGTQDNAAPYIEFLLEMRADLRKARAYELSDKVRDGLGELGVLLEDSAGGTSWRRK